MIFESFVVNPLQTLWRGGKAEAIVVGETHSNAHPASKVSDVEYKEYHNIALRAIRPEPAAQCTDVPRLRSGQHTMSKNLLFCVSKTYVARRAYSEAMLNTLF